MKVALNRTFAGEIINQDQILDEALSWIDTNLRPEEVFTTDKLEEWALDNGFKKEDNRC